MELFSYETCAWVMFLLLLLVLMLRRVPSWV